MVEFKSWRDTYLFLLNYGKFSCLNCKYGGHNLDLDAENSEFAYSHNFCVEHLGMVDFAFQFVCAKWVGENGETLDMDECAFDLPDEVIDKIRVGKWSFEEIRDLIEESNHEEIKE